MGLRAHSRGGNPGYLPERVICVICPGSLLIHARLTNHISPAAWCGLHLGLSSTNPTCLGSGSASVGRLGKASCERQRVVAHLSLPGL